MNLKTNTKHEALLQQLSAAFMSIPFNQMLGLKLDHLEDNHVTMHFDMKQDLIGNFIQGILHGGVISSVLDMAGGILVMSSAVNKNPNASMEELPAIAGKCSTVDLQISFMRPGKGERFIAKAWLIKSGSKIAFTRMELYDHDETLIATGNGTYLMG